MKETQPRSRLCFCLSLVSIGTGLPLRRDARDLQVGIILSAGMDDMDAVTVVDLVVHIVVVEPFGLGLLPMTDKKRIIILGLAVAGFSDRNSEMESYLKENYCSE